MHETVTTSTTSVNSFFHSPLDELLPPVNLTNRPKPGDRLPGESAMEGWHRESLSSHVSSFRRGNQPPKLSLHPGMTTRIAPESNASKTDTSTLNSDNHVDPHNNSNNQRWRLNGSGQLVDAGAAVAEWSLADEMVRLSIGQDVPEDSQGPMHTPPPSKMAPAAVLQINETSPLEGSSDASADSPPSTDMPINASHSRSSSLDTSSSQDSALSSASQKMLVPSHPPALKVAPSGEIKERPHSFSGGLSTAELRRLQQAGETQSPALEESQQHWNTMHNDRQYTPESQLTYPSLAQQATTMPRAQHQFDFRAPQAAQRDDPHVDYNMQPRNFHSHQHGHAVRPSSTQAPASFIPPRAANGLPALPYRQLPRGFAPQGPLASPTTLGYPPGHTTHLSLGSSQQLYDMMMPAPALEGHHPAVSRVQQQHNVFPRTHQHSASDSALRDAAALALLNGNMPVFGPPGAGIFAGGMAPPAAMSLYTSQFYPNQDPYSRADVAAAAQAMARLQSQYTGPYGVVGQGMGMENITPPGSVSGHSHGPSANNRKLGLYKTELCRSWEEKGSCRYATKCQFAHGEEELRRVVRHPKYKTEICRTFWVSGSCPYGKRCCFIHTELPASGTPPSAESAQPPLHGRERSLSTNSDPNDGSSSLLARISAKRTHEHTSSSGSMTSSTPVDMNAPTNSNYQFNARPPTGSLRVDTSTLDNTLAKQNKSAYPSFAGNAILQPPPDHLAAHSPAPVTAGPDLGRHTNSRLEIVGYNQQQRLNKASATNPALRHSFNGTDVELNFTPNTLSGFGITSPDGSDHAPARAHGHHRSGSAGNWGTISRSSHLSGSPYPAPSSPAGDVKSPWSTTELAVGTSRLGEKAWA